MWLQNGESLRRDKFGRRESEGALSAHGVRKVADQGEGLDVQVAEHYVRLPPAYQLDDIGVDLSAEERHCSSWAKAPRGDTRGVEPKRLARGVSRGQANGGRDVMREHIAGPGRSRERCVQRRVGRSIRGA